MKVGWAGTGIAGIAVTAGKVVVVLVDVTGAGGRVVEVVVTATAAAALLGGAAIGGAAVVVGTRTMTSGAGTLDVTTGRVVLVTAASVVEVAGRVVLVVAAVVVVGMVVVVLVVVVEVVDVVVVVGGAVVVTGTQPLASYWYAPVAGALPPPSTVQVKEYCSTPPFAVLTPNWLQGKLTVPLGPLMVEVATGAKPCTCPVMTAGPAGKLSRLTPKPEQSARLEPWTGT